MSHDTDDTPELAAQARRAWAESVQTRLADTVSASIAKAWREGGERAREHLVKLEDRLRDAGAADGLADQAMKNRAALEQLHELDEPDVRRVIELHIQHLQEGARRVGLPGLEIITASSLPEGRVNAMCANDPWDGSRHVFADGELLVFCNMLAKVVATAFVSTAAITSLPGLGAVRGPIRAAMDEDLLRRVVDLFSAVLFTGRSRISTPWLPETSDATLVAAALSWSMQDFAIGHELAHAAAGHLDVDSLAAEDWEGAEAKSELSRMQEFEADGLAFELIVASSSRSPLLVFQILAPYVFLKGIELLEQAQAVFGTAPSGFGSHPATTERLQLMKFAVPAVLPDFDLKLQSLRALAQFDAVFEAWRRPLIAFLQKAKAEGYAPQDGRVPYRRGSERPAILGPI